MSLKNSHSTCLEVVYKQESAASILSNTEILGKIWMRKALHLQFKIPVRINEMGIRQNSET